MNLIMIVDISPQFPVSFQGQEHLITSEALKHSWPRFLLILILKIQSEMTSKHNVIRIVELECQLDRFHRNQENSSSTQAWIGNEQRRHPSLIHTSGYGGATISQELAWLLWCPEIRYHHSPYWGLWALAWEKRKVTTTCYPIGLDWGMLNQAPPVTQLGTWALLRWESTRWTGRRKGEAEWFGSWGERQILRGEGVEEPADMNGQLATEVLSNAWTWAETKRQVLIHGTQAASETCVDICGSCYHW